MMKKTSLCILTILVLITGVLVLPLFYPAGKAIYFRLFLLIVLFLQSARLFKMIVIDGRLRKIAANTATVLFSIVALAIFLEAVFMFVPRSHSADYTLASKLWYKKYWHPVNTFGFRDSEPESSHPAILFVGDSFTAGHGLTSIHDRFSDIVKRELSDKAKKYSVVNLGIPNLDSRSEYDVMKNFLYQTRIIPDKIILQYCGNDIEGAAFGQGFMFEGFQPPADMNTFLLFIGSGSYLANFIYFTFPREHLGASYIHYLRQAYDNEAIVSRHKQDLQLFIDFSRQHSIDLIVVVFPFLFDIPLSDDMYVNDIVRFFKDQDVRVINVSDLALNMPLTERMVNKNDSHASAKLNNIVAQEILSSIR